MKDPCNLGYHRAIVAVDIEDSTSRTDAVKARLRERMYAMLEQSLEDAGIGQRDRDRLVDRGDGVLALIRPVHRAPKALLLNSVVPMLANLLRRHDAQFPQEYMRLRAVIHAGEILYDGHGCFGEALDIAFRLLDDPVVRRELRQVVSPMVLVVSDDIYRSVVRHGYPGIDREMYVPRVNVHVAGQQHLGWLKLTD
jgi:hypothetical protein